MRSAYVSAGAAAGLLLACAAILLSAGAIRAPAPTGPAADATISSASNTPKPIRQENAFRTKKSSVASDEAFAGTSQRIEPRDPLSDIGQALPPKPKPPGEWKGTILFNPVATAAGLIEAKGYTLAIAGVKAVGADETCNYQGRDWPCGLRARAAFRAWLRARAVTCIVPPDPERDTIVAECSVGKQNVAEWLVANGWARAEGDTYAALGDTASKTAKGIFGRPGPTEAATSSIITSTLPSPLGSDVILAPLPADREEAFPPAPPPPSSIVTLPAVPPAPAR